MSSSVKIEEKKKKKLKGFFDKNTSLSKRWRSLISFSEKATEEELHKFFNENFYMIYGVFWDTFSAYESGCKKGKHSNTEMMDLCTILHHVLVHLAELIRKKWQTRSIATVLEHLLYKENKIILRLKGMELMMLFVEAIRDLETSQIELFGASIDLSGFCVGNHQTAKPKIAALSAPDKGSVLVPSTTAGNLENTVKLWEFVLRFAGQKTNNFEFWLNLLKTEFFSMFYPSMSARMNIIPQEIGFRNYCPVQLQSLNVAHAAQWMKDPQISAVIWSSEENIQLLLEILRQASSVPIAEATTIRAAIGMMKQLFMGNNPLPADVAQRLPEFRRFFFAQLAGVFLIPNVNNVADHITLCTEVILELKSMYIDAYNTMCKETQESYLDTMLQVMINLFSNTAIVNSLADTLLDVILFIWIKTGRNAGRMWESLQSKVSSLFHFIQPIKQTKIKLVQLTLIINKMTYPAPKKGKKKVINRAPGGNSGFETMRKDTSPSVSPDDKPMLPSIPQDQSIVAIEWTFEELTFVWHQMMGVFSDVNSIKDPIIHAEAIQAISDIIEILQQTGERVSTQERKKMKHKALNLVDIFGRYLFEAVSLPSTHITGKSLAIGTLCRLIVRHHSDSLPLELLSHFYGALHQCLQEHSNSVVSHSILLNSSNIFNLALPGSSILIPHYLAEIKMIQSSSNNVVASIKHRCIIIVCSLICYPCHLESLFCPLNMLSGTGSEYDFTTTLKKDICDLLIRFANYEKVADHVAQCIWGCCNLIFEELFNDNPDLGFIKNITKNLFPLCTSADPVIARTSLDCLSTLAQISDKIQQLDITLVSLVVDILCSNINRLLTEQKQSKKGEINEILVADHFYCLLDWVMCNSSNIMNNKSIASKLFDAIEQGLLGQSLDTSETSGNEPARQSRFSTLRTQASLGEVKVSALLDSLLENPTHGSQIIKEASHILLIQLCNFLQTFPSLEGVNVLSTQLDEENGGSDPIFYIYNDFALFSLSEIELENGETAARLMLRDCTGRYAWDSTVLQHEENFTNHSLMREPFYPRIEQEIVTSGPSGRRPTEVPLLVTDERLKSACNVDQFDDLLAFLSETSLDCLLASGKPLNVPIVLRPEFQSEVDKIQKALSKQVPQDDSGVKGRMQELTATASDRIPVPPCVEVSKSKHHACRLLLHNLGFLEHDNLDSSRFYMVEDSQRFRRSLTQLDKTAGRELSKIGVIYVKEGQDDQKIILRNDTKSPLYAEFVRGLGWPIDIATHQGYLGGLDRKLTTGKTAPYFANYLFEVAFHEITSMPTNPTDPQQITKKRHVGNDIVHIVYSEHTSDYRPTTISSQFNDAHICVYPLPNGLFRIQIYSKEKVPFFGPLVHGMCVSKTLLPTLVRLTAVNANRCVRFNTGGYCRPFPTRRQALEEIVTRFKNEKCFVDVINELL